MRLAVVLIAAFIILQCVPESDAGKLSKKASKAVDAFKKLIAKIKEKIGVIKNECKAFFKKAKETIKNAVSSIKKKIESTGDGALKIIFKQIYSGLDKARKKLDDIAETADKKFYGAMEKAHEMFFTVTGQIENFNEKQRTILESKKEQDKGLQILDEFVTKSSEKVASCSDAALNPIKELYETTKGIIRGSVDKLEEIIKQVEKCMTMGMKADTLVCGQKVGSVAGDQLYTIGQEVMALKDKLLGGAVKELLNFVCIGKTRGAVELDKMSVEKKIKKLN